MYFVMLFKTSWVTFTECLTEVSSDDVSLKNIMPMYAMMKLKECVMGLPSVIDSTTIEAYYDGKIK